MQAAILYQDRGIRVGCVPTPEIGPDEVLVVSQYVGICGTDLHIYRGEFQDRVRYPAILGHEFGGSIEQVGSAVHGYRVGDRVAVDPILSCHRCPACLSGHSNACRSLRLLGIDVDGALAQYVAVPSDRLVPLPDSIPMEIVPMVELYGIGHHILRRGRVQLGETVVILGAGKVGLSLLDVLCHGVGPATTMITDVHPHRLQVSRDLGADYAVDVNQQDPVTCVMDITGGVGADCVIETIGHYHTIDQQDSPMAQAVQMVRNGGRIVTVGLGEQRSAIHFKTLVIKEAEIIASRVTQGEFPRAIQMLAKGVLHPDKLITHHMPASEVTGAFQQLDREEPDTLKIVLDMRNW